MTVFRPVVGSAVLKVATVSTTVKVRVVTFNIYLR